MNIPFYSPLRKLVLVFGLMLIFNQRCLSYNLRLSSSSTALFHVAWVDSGRYHSNTNHAITQSFPSEGRARIRDSVGCFSVRGKAQTGRTGLRIRTEESSRLDVEVRENDAYREETEEYRNEADNNGLFFTNEVSRSSQRYYGSSQSPNGAGGGTSLPTTLHITDNTSSQDEQLQIPDGMGNFIFEKEVNSDGDHSATCYRVTSRQLSQIEGDLQEVTNPPIADSLWLGNEVRDLDTSQTKTTSVVNRRENEIDFLQRDGGGVFEDRENMNSYRSFWRYIDPVTRLLDRFLSQSKARATLNRTSCSEKKQPETSVDGSGRLRDDGVLDKRSQRSLWRRRHARTLEEGIRRGRSDELSFLLDKAQIDARQGHDRSYVERTLMGIVNVLAEETEDLDIEVNTVPNSPAWRKEVKEFRINFSRLGFRPIRMGGTNPVDTFEEKTKTNSTTINSGEDQRIVPLSLVESADEGFDRIDEDNSGTLDRDELAQALSSITALETDRDSIEELASDLVLLYDVNGDGVVDREEYQQMVEDMARISPSLEESGGNKDVNPFFAVKDSIQSVSQKISKRAAEVASAAREKILRDDSAVFVDETEMGSIVLSNLKLDLRQFIFGALPLVKKLTPGGPLILEPFTATVTASFSPEDVMGSFLLDAGLRRLVARALRVRVRSFRDMVDGALFFGRRWKMTSKTAPVVEVLGLSNVEFDSRNRMIITGRARVRTSPDAPLVTNTFKVRTKIGTRKNGQVIRLVEPELAFVFECPPAVENGLRVACQAMRLPPPERPEPYYSFFPIYSPFKVDDNDGFDMGEDNCLRSIFIRNGKLRFEMSVVLRPGRFLGNHYLAFTVPQRTFIITMDRVWEGIRAARENKRVTARANKLKEVEQKESKSMTARKASNEQSLAGALFTGSVSTSTRRARLIRSLKRNKPKPKSFFSRFVEGYTMLEREGEANNERLTTDISDWFGRQGRNSSLKTAVIEQASSKNQRSDKQ